MRLADTTSIVTGGASGLGAATAKRLRDMGSQVFALDIEASIEANEKASDIHYLITDVSDHEQVSNSLNVVSARCASSAAPLRVAVSCAGVAPSRRLIGSRGAHDPELFARTIAVNLLGALHVLTAAASEMSHNIPLEDGARGVIINTASIAAFDGQIGQVAYAASKAGIAGITLPAARDLAEHGIRVCTIAPGFVDSPMLGSYSRGLQEELAATVPFPPRLARPEEFADLVASLVEHDYLNGVTIRMDGALRLAPR